MQTIKQYTNKYGNSLKNTMDNAVGNKYSEIKDWYEKVILEPVGNQIYSDDGESLELSITKQQSLSLQSAITDYTTENNSNIQTNISIKPITITLNGLLGENVVKAKNVNKAQKILQSKLNPIDNFINGYQTSKVQEYLNKAQDLQNKIDNIIDKVGVGIGYISNLLKDTSNLKQKEITRKIILLWGTRTLLNIQTDFITLTDMAIEDVKIEQTEESKDYISVSITFKQINYATVKTEKRQSKTAQNRQAISNNGKTQGKIKSQLSKIFSK